MKKIIAMLLAVVMVCALSVSVFAESETKTAIEDKELTVTGTYSQADHDAKAYSITLTWEALSFTYTIAAKTWDAETHDWVNRTTGSWTDNGKEIVIENNSSVAIEAYANYAKADGHNAVSGVFTLNDTETVVNEGAPAELAAPAKNADGTTATLVLTLDGDLTENTNGTIATVTIVLVDPAENA